MYQSTKTYGNERGLSCCFRQWKADSHCNLLHGYSLGFRFTFEAKELDERNWVYDFGDCGWIKEYLEDTFDHTLAVDKNDPDIVRFYELDKLDLARIVVFSDGVGCEKFAEQVFNYVSGIIKSDTKDRVRLSSVECFEHNANSAIYKGSM